MNAGGQKTVLIVNQAWFRNDLRALGWNAITLGFFPDAGFDYYVPTVGIRWQELLLQTGLEGQIDVLLYCDNSGPLCILGLESAPFLTVFVSIDSHHHGWHLLGGSVFDVALYGQKDSLAEVIVRPSASMWFPPWVNHWMEPQSERVDVTFCGNMDVERHPRRVEFFAEVSKKVSVHVLEGNYARIYAQARVGLNQCVNRDMNFRVFEVMASGAVLVTPRINQGLEELFCVEEDLLTYENDDPASAIEVLQSILADPERLDVIAKSGMMKTRRNHSSAARAATLVSLFEQRYPQVKEDHLVDAAAVYLLGAKMVSDEGASFASASARHAAALLTEAIPTLTTESIDRWCLSVLRCSRQLRKLQQNSIALELADLAFTSRPDNSVLCLLQLESLVWSGQANSARILAEAVSDKPDELIACASPQLDRLML